MKKIFITFIAIFMAQIVLMAQEPKLVELSCPDDATGTAAVGETIQLHAGTCEGATGGAWNYDYPGWGEIGIDDCDHPGYQHGADPTYVFNTAGVYTVSYMGINFGPPFCKIPCCTIEITVGPLSPPDCAANPTPANEATDISIDPTLSWDEVAEATSYEVYFGEFGSMIYIDEIATNNYSPTTLDYYTDYEWQILSKNSGGTATECETWTFTTIQEAPDCAANPIPANEAIDIAINPTLSWDEVVEATSYEVYFGESGSMTYIEDVTEEVYTPSTLDYNTDYEWQILSKNAGGTATGCETWTFTTEIEQNIDFNNSDNLYIYPNPANDYLNIEFDKNIQEISIVNILGESLIKINPNTKIEKIDISNLSSGIYIVIIKSNNKIYNKEIFVN